jgi:hypothetical protein
MDSEFYYDLSSKRNVSLSQFPAAKFVSMDSSLMLFSFSEGDEKILYVVDDTIIAQQELLRGLQFVNSFLVNAGDYYRSDDFLFLSNLFTDAYRRKPAGAIDKVKGYLTAINSEDINSLVVIDSVLDSAMISFFGKIGQSEMSLISPDFDFGGNALDVTFSYKQKELVMCSCRETIPVEFLCFHYRKI